MSSSSSSSGGGLPKVAYAIAAVVALSLGVAMCSKASPDHGGSNGSSVGGVEHTTNGGATRVSYVPAFCQDVPDKEVTAPHPADAANPNADGNWSDGLYVPAGCTTYPDRTVLNVQCKETGGAWKGVAEDGCVGSFERYQSKTGEAITVSIPFRPNV